MVLRSKCSCRTIPPPPANPGRRLRRTLNYPNMQMEKGHERMRIFPLGLSAQHPYSLALFQSGSADTKMKVKSPLQWSRHRQHSNHQIYSGVRIETKKKIQR